MRTILAELTRDSQIDSARNEVSIVSSAPMPPEAGDGGRKSQPPLVASKECPFWIKGSSARAGLRDAYHFGVFSSDGRYPEDPK